MRKFAKYVCCNKRNKLELKSCIKLYFEREDNDLKDKVCTDETFYSTLGYRAESISALCHTIGGLL